MQPEWEIWLDNQLPSAFAKIMQIEVNMVVKSSYVLKNNRVKRIGRNSFTQPSPGRGCALRRF